LNGVQSPLPGLQQKRGGAVCRRTTGLRRVATINRPCRGWKMKRGGQAGIRDSGAGYRKGGGFYVRRRPRTLRPASCRSLPARLGGGLGHGVRQARPCPRLDWASRHNVFHRIYNLLPELVFRVSPVRGELNSSPGRKAGVDGGNQPPSFPFWEPRRGD